MSKNIILYSLMLLLLIAVMGCGRSAAEVSDNSGGDPSPHIGNFHNLNLAVSDSDEAHISYDPALADYRIAVKKYSGVEMQTLNTNPVSAQRGAYSALAHHSDGTTYLAFSDEAQDFKITVMKNSGSGWSVVGAAGFSASLASYISIDVDNAGNPYVAYANLLDDVDEGGRVSVKKFIGGNWQSVGESYLTLNKAYFVSMQINPADNQPYLVYVDRLLNNSAVVKRFNGSSWELVGQEGFTGAYTYYTNIEISATGNIFVAYEDPDNSYRATVKNYSEGLWQNVGSAGFTPGEVYYNSLAISPAGTLSIAFVDSNNSSKVSVMSYQDSSWQNVGIAGFSAENASWTSMDYDSNSVAYVACKIGEASIPYLYRFNAGAWNLLASDF